MHEHPHPEAIVVIDDDYAMRLSCQQILAKAGYRVETFEDGATGLLGVAALHPALVVVDLKMPGVSGMEVIDRVNGIDPDIVLVVITGYATISTAVEAMKAGAYDFLPKPFSPDELRLIVRRGLERRSLKLQSQQWELERELLKRRFLTFVSHQLKTPLVAVHQYLDVLKRLGDSEAVAAKRQEWIDRCMKRTEGMRAIIDDWLTLSRVESGCLSQRRERVELEPILREIVTGHEQLAAEHRVSLDLELPEPPYPVCGDRGSLAVLFDNLIENAIVYNRPGGQVRVVGEATTPEVTIAVSDTGVGISRQHLPRLFDEFFRIRGGAAKDVEGTGLGLPISRRIVSELGGAIEVESEQGRGSTFRVRLPAARTAPVPAQPQVAAP